MTGAAYSGWGRTAPSVARAACPTTGDEVAKALSEAPAGGVIARGLGRSYGDPAQSAGGTVVECAGVRGLRAIDLEEGEVTALAGTSLDDLIRWLVPLGWFVPVTPGTRQVTVGGAVANDIHGKNHHVDGSFCAAVRSLVLELPGGERRVVGPDRETELFWATAGGMGLTGVVVEATFRLHRIETSWIAAEIERADDLDDCMARMEAGADRYHHSVAWVDTLATGARLGRAVLFQGDHARTEDLPARRRSNPLTFSPGPTVPAPPWAPARILNRFTLAAFNEVFFRRFSAERKTHLQPIGTFFHPLDRVTGWNRLYGPNGFLQHQCVVPVGGEDAVRHILERLSAARVGSFLTVLKRFGPGNPGPLSFPMQGWTLNLDIPIGSAGLGPLLDGIDDLVADAGGRLYLAKDSRMRPELLPVMYPRLEEWREVRRSVDPAGVLQSDLSRRLEL